MAKILEKTNEKGKNSKRIMKKQKNTNISENEKNRKNKK